MPEPIRQSYLFLPSYAPVILYATFFICGLIMLFGLYRHLRQYKIGLGEFFSLVLTDFRTKARRFLKYGLAQRKVIEGDSGGVMHGALFFGFLMLFAYTTLVFVQSDILPLFTKAVFLQGDLYLALEALGDTLGTAFIVGLAVAVYRRYVRKLEKLQTRWDDYVVLTMLIWIGLSGFMIEGLRLLAIPTQWAVFSPVGDAISKMVGDTFAIRQNQVEIVYQGFWWAHMFSVFALIAITPYTKLVHVFTSGANVAMAPEKPMGRLDTPFSLAAMMETGVTEVPPNAKSARDFRPLQLLALDACTNCGRCQEVCPAYAAGRDLSPRIVVQDLGGELRSETPGEDVIAKGVIREQELWSCTTCNACVNVCPVFINQVDYIVEFRRTLVAENKLDTMKRSFLENVGRSNNPFGLPQSDRQNWLVEMGVPTIKENPSAEYLYWVGCQGSYDPRARNVTRSVVKILRAAKLDFAILGNTEICTGEPVRRMGEEARFQELVMRNIETFKGLPAASGRRKVVVHCAHCFNTFMNEYPEFGADFFDVIHHSQLIEQLVQSGRLSPGGLVGENKTEEKQREVITFHDPCNLGRMNGVFDSPRDALLSVRGVELVEMERSRANSFCCGGGGANVWYQVPEKRKIGSIRVEEALKTGASTLGVACPFCITMFEDAAKTLGKETAIHVRDIAEIVADTLPSQEP